MPLPRAWCSTVPSQLHQLHCHQIHLELNKLFFLNMILKISLVHLLSIIASNQTMKYFFFKWPYNNLISLQTIRIYNVCVLYWCSVLILLWRVLWSHAGSWNDDIAKSHNSLRRVYYTKK